jgi:hypothetical protein
VYVLMKHGWSYSSDTGKKVADMAGAAPASPRSTDED